MVALSDPGGPLALERRWQGGGLGQGWGWASDIMHRACQFLLDLGNPNIPLQELACGIGFGWPPQECGGEAPHAPRPGGLSLSPPFPSGAPGKPEPV